jgi:hypothetical protein
MPDTETRSLVKKLCEVMAAIERVAKTGYNEYHKYHYAQEADLVDAIRGELASRKLFIFPNVTSCVRIPHEVETYKGIRKTQLTEISVDWTFVDGDSGEERTITVHGVGEDSVDKGFYKAFTGSEKYMLMKSFLIPTGDDPEKDSKEDARQAKERGKNDAQGVAQRKLNDAAEKGFVPLEKTVLTFRVGDNEVRFSGTAIIAVKQAMIKAGGKEHKPTGAWYVPLVNINQVTDAAKALKIRIQQVDEAGEIIEKRP